GITYPISRHGVRDHRAHTSTRRALSGTAIILPARMTRMARIPSGANPRRAAAKRSSDGSRTCSDMLRDTRCGRWGFVGPTAESGTRGGKDVLGASDSCELTMKARQRDAMHEIRAVVGSIRAAALKGRGCILDHGDGEPKVARHARRGRHAVVCRDPDNYERLDVMGAQ